MSMYSVHDGSEQKVCPCGHSTCEYHIIPSNTQLEGPMVYKGEDLSTLWLQQPVMSRSDARDWWKKYGLVCISGNKIIRTVYLEWKDICTCPKGHELKGHVKQGMENSLFQQHFSSTYPNHVPKYKIDQLSAVQQCPCGKTECDIHVIPSTVKIDSNVPLELHLKDKTVCFENTFRGLDCMSCSDIRDWFLGYPLKWDVEVTPKLIKLRMKCKCGQSFDTIPCQDCKKKQEKECSGCHRIFYKRYVKKGFCGNCRRTQIIHCEHCKKDVPRVHKCIPLSDMYFSFKFTGIYPPCIRKKDSDDVICPDCNKCMKNKVFHRHQYRCHSDLVPGTGGYSRDYKWHVCPYCPYKNCDITNVREHLKSHLTIRQHECRFKCGAFFTRPSAENLHCRIVHGIQDADVSSLKRVGNELVTETKKRKIHYVL